MKVKVIIGLSHFERLDWEMNSRNHEAFIEAVKQDVRTKLELGEDDLVVVVIE